MGCHHGFMILIQRIKTSQHPLVQLLHAIRIGCCSGFVIRSSRRINLDQSIPNIPDIHLCLLQTLPGMRIIVTVIMSMIVLLVIMMLLFFTQPDTLNAITGGDSYTFITTGSHQTIHPAF